MPKQATHNRSAPARRKAKGVVFLVSLLAGGLILLFGLGAWYMSNEGSLMNEEERRFAEYLNEKYGKEFVVDNVETAGAGFGVEGYRKGEAYATDDKDIRFNVMHSTKNDENTNSYSDTYLTTLWERDETSRARDSLASTLENLDYVVEIAVPHNIQTEIRGSVPSFQELKTQYPYKISYGLGVMAQGNFLEDEQHHYDNVFRLIEFLQEKSDLDTRLIYSVYLSDLRSPMASRYECYLTQDKISKVTSEGELTECFQKRGVEQ